MFTFKSLNCRIRFLVSINKIQLKFPFSPATRDDILSTFEIKFEVNHDLYKGFLLTNFQVVQSSKNRDKVRMVEREMSRWLNLMKIMISRGHQLTQDTNESGPLKELEHWRSMLAMFSHVSSFISSKEFNNFYRCLKLSRSKLISVILTNNNRLHA